MNYLSIKSISSSSDSLLMARYCLSRRGVGGWGGRGEGELPEYQINIQFWGQFIDGQVLSV